MAAAQQNGASLGLSPLSSWPEQQLEVFGACRHSPASPLFPNSAGHASLFALACLSRSPGSKSSPTEPPCSPSQNERAHGSRANGTPAGTWSRSSQEGRRGRSQPSKRYLKLEYRFPIAHSLHGTIDMQLDRPCL